MKTSYCLLCSFLCAIAVPVTAPAQQPVNPYDYFKLGETAYALYRFEYYRAVSDSLQDKLREHQALMKKVDVPSDVLSAFSSLAQTAITLPFSKPFNQWEEAEQRKWKTEGWPAQEKFLGALKKYVDANPQKSFFYWMGLHSLKLGWAVPLDVQYYGLAQMMSEIKGSDFPWLSQQRDLMATLAPEARDAIKTITAISAKADDPLGGGIGAADLDKMVAACQTIRQLARDNKLVGSQGSTTKF
jgi:hypothetical protein